MADDNPLLKALPPELDYISYLTIIEYNLNTDQLPVLHNILQDATLTANIGWDLVHLLLPLLPESQTCLQDVARLGNPREVVLKVTELLEALTTSDESGEHGEDEDQEQIVEDLAYSSEAPETQTEKPSPETNPSLQYDASVAQSAQEGQPTPRKLPSKVSQFTALVDMLSILHPRIKTRHPSRFLSTFLQAVLPAYATLLQHDEVTDTLLILIKTFAGTKRPKLPPRKSSTQILTQPRQVLVSAPDPEANEEPIAPEEDALQERLLQSFLTFVVEGYMSSLSSDDDTAAMSWSSRLQEQLHPEKVVPGRRTASEAFEHDEILHRRDSVVGQMLALARDLNLQPEELVRTIVDSEDPTTEESDDLPSSASEVPHSHPGCLYLLCATIASNILFQAPSNVPPLSVFHTFSSILSNFISDTSSPTIGTESPSVIDSLLFLGSYILETAGLGSPPEDDTSFTRTLQQLSLLSANTPIAPLRYYAHLLTSRLLHAHPDDQLRLSFIKDTLEHCPYENLKAGAVGWLKEEILAAKNTPRSAISDEANEPTKKNVFTTPTCIAILAPHLFLSPREMAAEEFRNHIPFFLAVLNFCYFLLFSEFMERLDLRGALEVVAFHDTGDWLDIVNETSSNFKAEDEQEGEEVRVEEGLVLMKGVVAMCREKLQQR
ncbi:MAG: hypothetical protein Q9201_007652 [Fulgogasparrea decipioides]